MNKVGKKKGKQKGGYNNKKNPVGRVRGGERREKISFLVKVLNCFLCSWISGTLVIVCRRGEGTGGEEGAGGRGHKKGGRRGDGRKRNKVGLRGTWGGDKVKGEEGFVKGTLKKEAR